MGKFSSDLEMVLFVACVVVLHLHLIFTSTYASINEYRATEKVPSTDVQTYLPWDKISLILYCAIQSLQVFGEKNNEAWTGRCFRTERPA
jgi:hypothetical protein